MCTGVKSVSVEGGLEYVASVDVACNAAFWVLKGLKAKLLSEILQLFSFNDDEKENNTNFETWKNNEKACCTYKMLQK